MALLVDPSRAPEVTLQALLQVRARTRPVQVPSQTMGLHQFIREAWPVLEPAVPFRDNWHIGEIADHLEAVSRGELTRLLVNVSPGTTKSLTVSVFWQAWEWTWLPWTRWLMNAYHIDLTERDTVKARRLIESPWYQQHWGHVFRFTTDQNTKRRFENDRTGSRVATSVGGRNTGEHAGRIVVDDCHNLQTVESDLERENTLSWWREVMPGRASDPEASAMVVIAQRVHEHDLPMDWLVREGNRVHHLKLPMEYEPRLYVEAFADVVGRDVAARLEAEARRCPVTDRPHDPRRQPGELLDEQRFPRPWADHEKMRIGTYAWSAQHQQEPAPRAGAIFNPAWFPDLSSRWPIDQFDRVQAWDLAFSELESADWTAAITLGVEPTADPRMAVLDIYRERIDEARLDEAMAEHIIRTRARFVFVEEGVFKKVAAVRDLLRRVERILTDRKYLANIDTVPADADKVSRARLIEGRCKAGYIAVDRRHPKWPALQHELTTFPKGQTDDLVDGLVHAVRAAIEKLAMVRAQRQLLGHSSRMQYVEVQPIERPWDASWDNLLNGVR